MVEAFRRQLEAYSYGIQKRIDEIGDKIANDVADLVISRSERVGASLDRGSLIEEIKGGLERARSKAPKVSIVFKDVTYEQTQNEDFFEKVDEILPAPKRAQLGKWSHHYEAVRSRTSDSGGRE
jgi:hypothetical protein